MRIHIPSLAPGVEVLAGSYLGKQLLSGMISATVTPVEPQLCFMDLDDRLASASCLRESVVAYRTLMRRPGSALYPVVANLSAETAEELFTLMDLMGDAIMACRLDPEGHMSGLRVVGRLEAKLRLTLDLVEEMRVTDTTSLRERLPEEGVPTLWNNRLGALVAKGLVAEFPAGRAKKFKSMEEMGGADGR